MKPSNQILETDTYVVMGKQVGTNEAGEGQEHKHTLGKHSSTELQPQSFSFFFAKLPRLTLNSFVL